MLFRNHRRVFRKYALALPILAAPALVAAQATTFREDGESNRRSGASSGPAVRDSGLLTVRFRNRQFFIPEDVVDGLKIQPAIGVDVRPARSLRLSLDVQTVDNSGPGLQGEYRARRTLGPGVGSGNFLQELTLGADLRLWSDSVRRRSVRVAGSVTQARRSYAFSTISPDVVVSAENRSDAVVSLSLPLTTGIGNGTIGVAPVVAFFPDDNALYFRRLPDRVDERFGTSVGIMVSAATPVGPRLSVWGKGFVPFTGNNTIRRDSGLPSRVIAYDAGLRLAVNDALSAEVFLSNSLGDAGALALTADGEYRALGTGISFLPLCAMCARDLRELRESVASAYAPGAASLLITGGAAPSSAEARVRGGSRGYTALARYSPVGDLSLGVFVDWLNGTSDESELGAVGAITLMPQTDARRVALDVVVAASRSNNVFVNFLERRIDAFDDLGLEKSAFRFGTENEREGEVYLFTLALPARYRSASGVQAWIAPTATIVQRKGRQMTGAIVGGALPLWEGVEISAEVGAPFGRRGNVVTVDGPETVTVWTVALARTLSSLGGELVLSGGNRLGDSPFHALRALADNRLAFNAGVRLLR